MASFSLNPKFGKATFHTSITGLGTFPDLRGTYGVLKLPTDPIGSFVLTLTGLVVGSAIQVETVDGIPIENRTADSNVEVFTLSVYSSGNTLNNLRVKVRKGSSLPYYHPWETLVTSVMGSQSIYVSQILD